MVISFVASITSRTAFLTLCGVIPCSSLNFRCISRGLIQAGIGYLLSFLTDIWNSTYYTFFNHQKLSHDHRFILLYVAAMTVLAVVLGIVLLRIKNCKLKLKFKIVSWVIRAALIALPVFIIWRIYKDMPPTVEAGRLTILALTMFTGIFIPLMIYVSTLIFTDRWTDSKEHLILLMLFSYFVLGYTMLANKLAVEFYYYGRYLTMYIPMILLLGAVILDRLKKRYALAAFVLSLALFVPFDYFHLTHRDDTRVQWDSISELEETVRFEGTQCVVMRKEMIDLFYCDLKSLGLDCYPITEDFDREIEILADCYDNILIMDYIADENIESRFPLIRRFYNLDTQDLGDHRIKFAAIPLETTYNCQTISLYRYVRE